jgi:hypothetical protein
MLDKCVRRGISVAEVEWSDTVLAGICDDVQVRDLTHKLVESRPDSWFYIGGAMDVTRLGNNSTPCCLVQHTQGRAPSPLKALNRVKTLTPHPFIVLYDILSRRP